MSHITHHFEIYSASAVLRVHNFISGQDVWLQNSHHIMNTIYTSFLYS